MSRIDAEMTTMVLALAGNGGPPGAAVEQMVERLRRLEEEARLEGADERRCRSSCPRGACSVTVWRSANFRQRSRLSSECRPKLRLLAEHDHGHTLAGVLVHYDGQRRCMNAHPHQQPSRSAHSQAVIHLCGEPHQALGRRFREYQPQDLA